MRKIATPTELDTELRAVMRSNREGAAREDLATSLSKLAEGVDRTAANTQVLNLGKLTTTARNGLWELDEKYIGTDDYMGVAYFWSLEYKWELRDAAPMMRQKVHAAFRQAKLKVDDDSPEHAKILEKFFGRRGPR